MYTKNSGARDFFYTKNSGDRDFIYTKNSGVARVIYLRNPIRKRYSSQKIFPLRGQFIHCDFIYTKNSGGRPCRKSLFYWSKIGQRLRIFGFWSGDDARENGDFQREKQRLEGTKNFMKITFLNIANVDDIESLWHVAKEAGALYGKWNMYWIY